MNIFFNDDVLLDVARDRGYMNIDALAKAWSAISGEKWKKIKDRIKSGRITFEDSFILADWFAMTPVEYCDTFLNGMFVVDENGHYIARVENVARVLKPSAPGAAMLMRNRVKRQTAEEKRTQLYREIIEELEKM